jgi:hypothetical protein
MNEILKENDFFKTSDISLSSTLCCCGYQIEAIDRNNPSKAIFWIRRDDQLDDLIKLYFTHQLKIDPIGFFNCLKEIKTRIYNIGQC